MASDGDEESEAVSVESILIAGQRNGLDFNGMMRMTIGQIIDYCVESMNQMHRAEQEQDKKKEQKKRRATQADIDAFFGPPRSRHG